jgi:hypothetical protein
MLLFQAVLGSIYSSGTELGNGRGVGSAVHIVRLEVFASELVVVARFELGLE